MPLGKLVIALALVVTMGGGALAQSPIPFAPPSNPVQDHYRAYRTALEGGNPALAEIEAAAALDASLARDGEGGRTAVLALNLALVRLDQNRAASAQEPARLAHAISASRGDSTGVDPIAAQLVVARADAMADQSAQPSAQALAQLRAQFTGALASADGRADLASVRHASARAIGDWGLRRRQFATARLAWAQAAELANGATFDDRLARGEARIGEGIAILSETRERERVAGGVNVEAYVAARGAFAEASGVLYALVREQPRAVRFSQVDIAYATAVGWRSLVRAIAQSAHFRVWRRLYGEDQTQSASSGSEAQQPCVSAYRVRATPLPEFPTDAIYDGRIGVVVVRLLLNDTGGIDDRRIAVALPEGSFRRSVESVFDRWAVAPAPNVVNACGADQVLFLPIVFAYPR